MLEGGVYVNEPELEMDSEAASHISTRARPLRHAPKGARHTCNCRALGQIAVGTLPKSQRYSPGRRRFPCDGGRLACREHVSSRRNVEWVGIGALRNGTSDEERQAGEGREMHDEMICLTRRANGKVRYG